MKISLIIPALDEEASLPDVLAAVPPTAVDEIIVVDNGCTDGTAAVARRAGAQVVVEPRKGYGAACWSGFKACQDDCVLVFMDGDGSFEPGEIPRLTKPITCGTADMVLGSRTLGVEDARAIPLHARVGNKFVVFIIGVIAAIRITDVGPFRAISRKALENLNMQERTYGWPCEMIMKAGMFGYRVVEVPVTYRPRTGGKSKVSGTIKGSIRAAIAMLSVLIRWSFWSPNRNLS